MRRQFATLVGLAYIRVTVWDGVGWGTNIRTSRALEPNMMRDTYRVNRKMRDKYRFLPGRPWRYRFPLTIRKRL
jgi:hypothetical protein